MIPHKNTRKEAYDERVHDSVAHRDHKRGTIRGIWFAHTERHQTCRESTLRKTVNQKANARIASETLNTVPAPNVRGLFIIADLRSSA